MNFSANYKTFFVLLLVASLIGCSKGGAKRVVVTGSITWQGKPVPRGVILFDPDVTKQNRGPQGYALVIDGKYDTTGERSKGSVVGPQKVLIEGFDGKNIDRFRPYGDPLFQAYETTLDIPANGGNFDIVVPNSVKAVPAGSNRDMP